MSATLPPSSLGWRTTRLLDVTRHHSGNGKLIKGKLSDAPADGLFPAFSASGQDVWRDAFEHEGDAIIVSAVGARCGKCFLASGKWSAVANTHVVWPNPEHIERKFLWYRVNDERFWERSGSAQPFVVVRKTFERDFLLPPLPEQRRIVAEIEKQFTRLEAGVAALRRVQANLKRYRAAVLKAACEGKLVSSLENRALDSWCFTELGKVVTFAQGLQVPVPEQRFEPSEGDVPFLRIVNYTQADEDFRYISNPGAKYHVHKDDVVMVRYGAPGFVGRGFEGVIANNLRVIPQSVLGKSYLFYYLKSKAVADLIRSRQKGGTMQAISFGQLKDIPISIPPLAEQTRIVAEVERRLSVVEELEAVVSANLQRATRLRQSILQKAFTGELT